MGIISALWSAAAVARAEGLLVTVQAYIDDSKSDFGDRYLILAGYVNTAEMWARFSDAWYEELHRSPAIDYMKMVEAFGRNGQFRGWTEEDRDQKIEDLARIIRHFKPISIHASISQRQVQEIIKPVAPYGMASAYSLCFQSIIVPIATYQSRRRDLMQVPIDFIFDNQEGLGNETRELYQSVRAMQPKSVQKVLSREPLFRDDKLVMPLQAADMLAWHIRRHYERGDPGAFPVPKMLSSDGQHSAYDMPESLLKHLASQFAQVPGAALLSKKSHWKRYKRDMKSLGLTTFPSSDPIGRENAVNRFRKFLARFIGR